MNWPVDVCLLTFDLVSQLAALVLREVDDGRRGGRSEAILLHLTPVPLLSGQHALVTLPLIEVVSGLGEVHVETTGVFFVRAGAQTNTVTCGRGRRQMNKKVMSGEKMDGREKTEDVTESWDTLLIGWERQISIFINTYSDVQLIDRDKHRQDNKHRQADVHR